MGEQNVGYSYNAAANGWTTPRTLAMLSLKTLHLCIQVIQVFKKRSVESLPGICKALGYISLLGENSFSIKV